MCGALKAPSLITSREEGIRSWSRVELRLKEQWNGRTTTGRDYIGDGERGSETRFGGWSVEWSEGGDMVDLTDPKCS